MGELRLDSLSKTFGGKDSFHAVKNLSFTAKAGECVALLGPSGAGKSTVLRLIAGLEAPTSGAIYLGGGAIQNLIPAERQVSMAFQFPALLPHLTVAENLALGPKLRRLKDAEQKALHASEILGITALANRRPDTLSGGEQQKVALGRALVAGPRLLLLDEPLASLDPFARIELRGVIRRIQRELKLTTVYVTHDQVEAAAVADRIAILRKGELQQFAPPREVYQQPKNLFVAHFFGADGLNLLPARISVEQGLYYAEVSRSRFRLGKGISAPDNSQVTLGFRPSAAQVRPSVTGVWVIADAHDLGWETVLRLVAEKVECTIRLSGSRSGMRVGDRADLEVNPSELYLFDLTSGERLH